MVDQMYVEKLVPTHDVSDPPKYPIVFVAGAWQTGNVSQAFFSMYVAVI